LQSFFKCIHAGGFAHKRFKRWMFDKHQKKQKNVSKTGGEMLLEKKVGF
jgi:hypothetical protein